MRVARVVGMASMLPRAFAIALFLSLGAGCGSVSSSSAPATDAGGLHAIDDTVVSIRVARVMLGAPAGCDASSRTVTYDRATYVMTWPGCDASTSPTAFDAGMPYPEVKRVLDLQERAQVEAALAAITYVEHPACSAYDGREWFMDTVDASGAKISYSAQNVNCYGYRLASGLPALYDLLESIRGA